MARLSKSSRRPGGRGPDDDGADPFALLPVICRPAQRDEIDDALRLLLAGPNGPAGDEQVLDFLSFAVHRGVDVNAMWIATRGDGRLEWSLLPVVSPGRTMLVLSPGCVFRHMPIAAIHTLIGEVCAHYAMRDVHLAQLL